MKDKLTTEDEPTRMIFDQPVMRRALAHYLNTINLRYVLVDVVEVNTNPEGEFQVWIKVLGHTRQEKMLVATPQNAPDPR